MTRSRPATSAPHTHGMVIRWARLYDTVVKVISLGREDVLREQTVALAELQPGQHVLDVGCGTGTLVIAAARSEPTIEVQGIDPASTMIERARSKAEAAGVAASFEVGVVEKLNVDEGSVDVVLSSLMLHHLPGDVLQKGLEEIFRVLRPGGRFVAVDFFGRGPLLHRLGSLFHGNHSHAEGQETKLMGQLRDVGFVDIERGQLRPRYLSSLVAHKTA